MDNFDYLSNILAGQYLPVVSPIHRLDARTKIAAGFLLLVAITIAPNPLGVTIGLAAALAGLVMARIPLGYYLRSLLTALPLLLILAGLQALVGLHRGEALFQAGPIYLSRASLIAAGLLLLRFAAYIGVLSLASYCISPSELTHGLEALLTPLASLGVPVKDIVLVIQVTLRFLPTLAQTAERIAKAQASRGAEWGSGERNLLRRVQLIVPLIVPLFLVSLQRAENLALAMDARGYASAKRRTSMVELHFRSADALALVVTLLISVLIPLI